MGYYTDLPTILELEMYICEIVILTPQMIKKWVDEKESGYLSFHYPPVKFHIID